MNEEEWAISAKVSVPTSRIKADPESDGGIAFCNCALKSSLPSANSPVGRVAWNTFGVVSTFLRCSLAIIIVLSLGENSSHQQVSVPKSCKRATVKMDRKNRDCQRVATMEPIVSDDSDPQGDQ